jgi:hypothetical protein
MVFRLWECQFLSIGNTGMLRVRLYDARFHLDSQRGFEETSRCLLFNRNPATSQYAWKGNR